MPLQIVIQYSQLSGFLFFIFNHRAKKFGNLKHVAYWCIFLYGYPAFIVYPFVYQKEKSEFHQSAFFSTLSKSVRPCVSIASLRITAQNTVLSSLLFINNWLLIDLLSIMLQQYELLNSRFLILWNNVDLFMKYCGSL